MTTAANGHDTSRDDDEAASVSMQTLQALPFGLGQAPQCDRRTCTQPGAPLDLKSPLADQISTQLTAIFSTFVQTSLRYLGVNEILDYLEQSRTVDTWLLTGLQQGWSPGKLADEHNLELGRTALKDVILDALDVDDEAWACSLREVGFSSGLSMAFEGIIQQPVFSALMPAPLIIFQLKYSHAQTPPCLHTLMSPTGLAVLKSAPLKHSFPVCPPRNPPSPQSLISSIRNLISSGVLSGPDWAKPAVWRSHVRKAFTRYHALIKEVAEEVITSPSFAVEFQIFIDSVASPLELFRLIADDFETEFGSTMSKGLLCVGDTGGPNLFQIMDFCDAGGPSKLVARVKARVAEKREISNLKHEIDQRRRQIEAFKQKLATCFTETSIDLATSEMTKLGQEMDDFAKRLAVLQRSRAPPRMGNGLANNGKMTPVNGADGTSNKPQIGSSRDLMNAADPFAATAPRAVSPAQSLKGKGKAPALKHKRPAPTLAKQLPPILPKPPSPASVRLLSPASKTSAMDGRAGSLPETPSKSRVPRRPFSQSVSRQTSPSPHKTLSSPSSSCNTTKSKSARSSFDEDEFGDCACCSACAHEMLHTAMAPVLAHRSVTTSTPPEAATVTADAPRTEACEEATPARAITPPTPALARVVVEQKKPAQVKVAKLHHSASDPVSVEPAHVAPAVTTETSPANKKTALKRKKQTKKKSNMCPPLADDPAQPSLSPPHPVVKSERGTDVSSVLALVVDSKSDAEFVSRLQMAVKPVDEGGDICFPFMPEARVQALETWSPRSGCLPPKSCPPDRCTGEKPNHTMWRWLDGLLYETCLAAFKYELIYNIADPLTMIRDKLVREFLTAGLKMTDDQDKPVDMTVYLGRYETQLWAAIGHPEVQLVTRRTLAIALIKLMSVFTAQLGPVCICTLSNHPEVLANALSRLREGEEADRLEPVDLVPIDQEEFFKWTHGQIRAGVLSGPEWEGLRRQRRVIDYLFSFEDAFQAAVDRLMVRQPYRIAEDLIAMLEYTGGIRTFDTAMRLCLNTVDADEGSETMDGKSVSSEPGSLGDDVLLPADGPLASWEKMISLSMNLELVGRRLTKQQAEEERQKGNRQFAASQFADAVVSFSTASLMVPSDATYWTNCAAARIKIGTDAHMSQAVSDCTTALELDPKNIKALYRRATAMHHLDLFDDAVKDLEKLLKLSPDNLPAEELLRTVKGAIGRRNK
ncbi:hypothetical protein OIV83_005661 [Microbotryomycetes sp. JL201]|nr:hypothetical protein OIV83_005661 [Microbotryomycetes sp. JL201]